MTSLEAWNSIIKKLTDNRMEFPTNPKRKQDPVWFSATTYDNFILINEASEHKPSSKFSMQRKLTYKTFEKVYPFYFKSENGESVSTEVKSITVNQVYYFSIIKYLAN